MSELFLAPHHVDVQLLSTLAKNSCHEKYCPYMGVHWSAQRDKWRAKVSRNHIQYYVADGDGKTYFNTAKEACTARDRHIRKKNLDLSMLNCPTEAEIRNGVVTIFSRKIVEFSHFLPI